MQWGIQALPQGHWSAQIDGVEISSGKEDDAVLGQVAALMAVAREMKKRHLLQRATVQDALRAKEVEGR